MPKAKTKKKSEKVEDNVDKFFDLGANEEEDPVKKSMKGLDIKPIADRYIKAVKKRKEAEKEEKETGDALRQIAEKLQKTGDTNKVLPATKGYVLASYKKRAACALNQGHLPGLRETLTDADYHKLVSVSVRVKGEAIEKYPEYFAVEGTLDKKGKPRLRGELVSEISLGIKEGKPPN